MESPNTEGDPGRPGGGGYGDGPAAPTDLEGQRAWIADLDRKLTTRSYIGAAAAVMALAAAIVAIVLAVDTRENSASKGDVKRIEQQIGGIAADASTAEDAQAAIDSLSERIDALQDTVDAATGAGDQQSKRLDVVEGDIEDLRQQIDSLDSGGTGSGGTGSGG
jgi:septal ring factor EnvC (AmiA/AmiB activator)